MIRYLITPGDADADEVRWLRRIEEWMRRGVDFVQIRERELSARRVAELTRKTIAVRKDSPAKILINDRADIAIACGADGVHLRDGSPAAEIIRYLFRHDGRLISIACHSADAVAKVGDADLIVLGPVFEPISKITGTRPLGVEGLRRASALTRLPLIALGGVTADNEGLCYQAGAAGIAGISYFL